MAILAGGLATRLRPLTASIPKLLIEVAGEPFFNHQLRLLRRQGLTRLVLCIGHLGEQIETRYGNGAAHGVEIRYSFDGPALLGTGGALRQALPLLGDAFYVLYGDSYLPTDFRAAAQKFFVLGKPALMTIYQNHNAYDSSNVWFQDGEIRLYTKTDRSPQMQHIDYGLSVFSAEVFASQPRHAAFDLSTLQSDLSRRGDLAALEVHERFYEIGSPAGIVTLDQHLRTCPDVR